jgi:ribosome biogenesis GTPase
MAKKSKKIRTSFRKNRGVRTRPTDWTRQFDAHGFQDEAPPQQERISGKGELARKRTVYGAELDAGDEPGALLHLDVDETVCRGGRVLSVRGLVSTVRDDDGRLWQCAVRRLLKTLDTGQRHAVAAGDRVAFRPAENTDPPEGIIERVEPRHGVICRTSRGRRQVLVANVDQLMIVASAAEPRLKPNLIDRMLIAAEKGRVAPTVCINKIDLVEPAALEPLVGVYAQMGYEVLLLSAKTGFGLPRFRRRLEGRENVVVGQSGVGKSSLLNAVDAGLGLRVREISRETSKGRHTTTTAELLPLSFGGYVVDTPGVRQFALWDVIPEEIPGFFRDMRPYVSRCRYPDCTHTHEEECAVKDAVADGRIDERRYESYCRLIEGEAM